MADFRMQDNVRGDDGIPDDLKIQLIKRIHKINSEDGFIASLIPILNQEIQDSNRNRDKYFRSEEAILLFSGSAGLLSAMSTSDLFSEKVMPSLILISSVISFLSTFLIGLRGLRKWQETWLRHRRFVNMCNTEVRKYACYVSPYQGYRREEDKSDQENSKLEREYEEKKLQELKETVFQMIEQNNSQFLNNMAQKERNS